MLNKIFKSKGWTTAGFNISQNWIFVKLVIDGRCQFFCPHCGTALIRHTSREIKIRDLPISDKHVTICAQTFGGRCPQCQSFSTIRPPLAHPSMGFTRRMMEQISRRHLHEPAQTIADFYAISIASVLRIDKWVLSTTLPPPRRDELDAILIDEKYLGPSHGFVTMVLHAHSGEPIYMSQGKDGKALDAFFASLTEEQKQAIRYVGIDRANAYKAAALTHLPHVEICYDAYHLVSNMNEVVDKIRRKEMAHPPEALRRRLVGMRYILLRANEKLDQSSEERLNTLLLFNRTLNKAYILKEQFRSIFRCNNEYNALLSLISWVKMSVASGIPLLKRFAIGIADKFNGIMNGIRYGVNSARIESANAAIKRIMSRSCGLGDSHYLFNKLRQAFFLRHPFLRLKLIPICQQI
jgi:transposase